MGFGVDDIAGAFEVLLAEEGEPRVFLTVGNSVVAVFGGPFYDAEGETVWGNFGVWGKREFFFFYVFVFWGLGFVLIDDGAAAYAGVGEEADGVGELGGGVPGTEVD